MKMYSYLALGDSYTIGEQVTLADSFPYQTIQSLRTGNGKSLFAAPEIIAKTGWTTDELSSAIDNTQLLPEYDIVSLLIGVNNQYRGRDVENYKEEYRRLLQRAIGFAGNNTDYVYVLSIPDWGVTPFAEDRDREQIKNEIDLYNSACKQITQELRCHYIDITDSQRVDGMHPAFLAADGLHPSGKEYAKWSGKLANAIKINQASYFS